MIDDWGANRLILKKYSDLPLYHRLKICLEPYDKPPENKKYRYPDVLQ